jgi:uncharacterized protein (TIGR02246 family)
MSTTSRSSSLLLLGVLLAACSSPPAKEAVAAAPPAPDTAAIRATITSTEKQWSAAYMKGDGAGVAALYTEDAASVPLSGEWKRGRDAIAKDEMSTLGSYDIVSREDIPEEVTVTGDYAVEIGHFAWKGKAKKGGAIKSESGRYVVLWRKDADGTWRIHRDIGATAPAAKP